MYPVKACKKSVLVSYAWKYELFIRNCKQSLYIGCIYIYGWYTRILWCTCSICVCTDVYLIKSRSIAHNSNEKITLSRISLCWRCHYKPNSLKCHQIEAHTVPVCLPVKHFNGCTFFMSPGCKNLLTVAPLINK